MPASGLRPVPLLRESQTESARTSPIPCDVYEALMSIMWWEIRGGCHPRLRADISLGDGVSFVATARRATRKARAHGEREKGCHL